MGSTPCDTPLNQSLQSLPVHTTSTLLSDVSPAPSARLSCADPSCAVPAGVPHESSSLCYTPTTPAWSRASPFGDLTNRIEPQTSPRPERSRNLNHSDSLPDASMPDLGGFLVK